jgi:hypothetical protein
LESTVEKATNLTLLNPVAGPVPALNARIAKPAVTTPAEKTDLLKSLRSSATAVLNTATSAFKTAKDFAYATPASALAVAGAVAKGVANIAGSIAGVPQSVPVKWIAKTVAAPSEYVQALLQAYGGEVLKTHEYITFNDVLSNYELNDLVPGLPVFVDKSLNDDALRSWARSAVPAELRDVVRPTSIFRSKASVEVHCNETWRSLSAHVTQVKHSFRTFSASGRDMAQDVLALGSLVTNFGGVPSSLLNNVRVTFGHPETRFDSSTLDLEAERVELNLKANVLYKGSPLRDITIKGLAMALKNISIILQQGGLYLETDPEVAKGDDGTELVTITLEANFDSASKSLDEKQTTTAIEKAFFTCMYKAACFQESALLLPASADLSNIVAKYEQLVVKDAVQNTVSVSAFDALSGIMPIS